MPSSDLSVFIDNVAISQVTLLKYLGVSFVANKLLEVDIS